MNKKYIVSGLLVTSLLLTACGNDDSSDSKDQHGSKSTNSEKHRSHHNEKHHEKKNVHRFAKKKDGSSSSSSSHQENTQSAEYYAKVWLTVFGPSDVDEFMHSDVSGNKMNPLDDVDSASYPDGMQLIVATPRARGVIHYTNNNDGTITVYDVPSHFQDRRWMDDDYSRKESQRILNNGDVYKLKHPSQSQIDKYAALFTNLNGNDGYAHTTKPKDDSSDDSSDHSTKVTRSNVIDKVEEYEGHALNTDKYIFKEPEKTDSGNWGFSYTDKAGKLRGSYIIDEDGNVTKYNEDGEET